MNLQEEPMIVVRNCIAAQPGHAGKLSKMFREWMRPRVATQEMTQVL